jgi:hypothetical protein
MALTTKQINEISRGLVLANKYLRDYNALRQGKIVGRVSNRVKGRLLNKTLRALNFWSK